ARGTFGPAPHFPERSLPSRTSGSTTGTVARRFETIQGRVEHSDAISRATEPDADRRLEPALDVLVQRADDAIELGNIEVFEQHATDEIDVAVGADRKVRGVRRVIVLQQISIQLFAMRRRIRHEVQLVAQRSLVQVEVDRRGVTTVATEAHIPAWNRGVVLDGLHPRLARNRGLQML